MKLVNLRTATLALGLLALAGCAATSPVEQNLMIDAGTLRWEVSDAPTHDFRVYLLGTTESDTREERESIAGSLLSVECTQIEVVRERTVAMAPILGRARQTFVLDLVCDRG